MLAGEAGDPTEARYLFPALLPVLGRVFRPRHPEILTARANLAAWAGETGDPAARDLIAQLLPTMERVFGSEYPDTLASRDGFAYWVERARHSPSTGSK